MEQELFRVVQGPNGLGTDVFAGTIEQCQQYINENQGGFYTLEAINE